MVTLPSLPPLPNGVQIAASTPLGEQEAEQLHQLLDEAFHIGALRGDLSRKLCEIIGSEECTRLEGEYVRRILEMAHRYLLCRYCERPYWLATPRLHALIETLGHSPTCSECALDYPPSEDWRADERVRTYSRAAEAVAARIIASGADPHATPLSLIARVLSVEMEVEEIILGKAGDSPRGAMMLDCLTDLCEGDTSEAKEAQEQAGEWVRTVLWQHWPAIEMVAALLNGHITGMLPYAAEIAALANEALARQREGKPMSYIGAVTANPSRAELLTADTRPRGGQPARGLRG